MATGKALDGKPYAGNPHVRFDEGEVAPAATPRRGSLLYNNITQTLKSVAIGAFALPLVAAAEATADVRSERRLSVAAFRDKAEAAWVGQIAGVCWGAPTEFKFVDTIMPDDKVPVWRPEMINDAFRQDDLYVEMTFLRTLECDGLDVDIRRAGIDFANSRYPLWCANVAGRSNLRKGIAPPDTGHPEFNSRGNDIDYQIEADFAGIISPGLPNSVIGLSQTFGRLMNYGDGVLGGVFIGAMYAEAYFATNSLALIQAGLAAIPAESDYAEMVRSIIEWHTEDPTDWEGCWRKIVAKYRPAGKGRPGPKYVWRDTNGDIDVRINGAMVVLGLLYGDGDLDRTMRIALRGGYDSDCNPSSAGGPLFATVGSRNLPTRYREKLVRNKKFDFTDYDFDGLMAVTEKLARQVVVRQGGRVEKDANGDEWFVIPVQKPCPPAYVPTWRAEKPLGVRYTDEEMTRQKYAYREPIVEGQSLPDPTERVQKALDALAPGWTTSQNASDMRPGFVASMGSATALIRTHPPARREAVTLSRTLKVPAGNPVLRFDVANSPGGDFRLVVRVDGCALMATDIGDTGAETPLHLRHFDISLAPWTGKTVTIELVNEPTGWMCEAAYWHGIRVTANAGDGY